MSPRCSQIVRTSSSVQRLLLVSSNSFHESDFLASLRKATSQRPNLQFELTYLTRLRRWIFFRSSLYPGSSPIRFFCGCVPGSPGEHVVSRPSLIKSWATAAQVKTATVGTDRTTPKSSRQGLAVQCRNRSMLLVLGASRCTARFVYVMLVFPGDLGGNSETGPSSIWDLQEIHAVDGVNDSQRGAAFTVISLDRTTFGVVHQVELSAVMHRGWPSLLLLGSDLHSDGPLPPSCPCLPAHAPLEGVDLREDFSSSSTALGEQFWWLCAVPFLDPENASLGAGGTAHAAYSGPSFSTPSPRYPVRFPLPLLSSTSSSKCGL